MFIPDPEFNLRNAPHISRIVTLIRKLVENKSEKRHFQRSTAGFFIGNLWRFWPHPTDICDK